MVRFVFHLYKIAPRQNSVDPEYPDGTIANGLAPPCPDIKPLFSGHNPWQSDDLHHGNHSSPCAKINIKFAKTMNFRVILHMAQ
jgi:hypothetical protein